MTFQDLKETVPWGRPFDEYVSMFDLSPSDLVVRLLDCGAGPSSFAAEASARGCQVVACDPLYRFNANDIALRIDEIYPLMVANMEAARNRFVWTWAGSPSRHAEQRMTAMRQFLADFNLGHREGRYVAGALPRLPFANDSFDPLHLVSAWASANRLVLGQVAVDTKSNEITAIRPARRAGHRRERRHRRRDGVPDGDRGQDRRREADYVLALKDNHPPCTNWSPSSSPGSRDRLRRDRHTATRWSRRTTDGLRSGAAGRPTTGGAALAGPRRSWAGRAASPGRGRAPCERHDRAGNRYY